MNEAVPQQINVTAPDDLSTGNHGDISPSDMIGSQPCSTLFVANLEPHHTENDISHLFEKLVVNWEKVFSNSNYGFLSLADVMDSAKLSNILKVDLLCVL